MRLDEEIEFIQEYPGMRLRPKSGDFSVLAGVFEFSVPFSSQPALIVSYNLEIRVPTAFPKDLPKVIETAECIPRDGHHHVNADGTLCLGSPLRLLIKLSKNPTLVGFADNCLVPYLYAVSLKLRDGAQFTFGELPHGDRGALEDYSDILGLKDDSQVKKALELLCLRESYANKYPCPCGCGKRLGKCKFRKKLGAIRKLSDPEWFKKISHKICYGS